MQYQSPPCSIIEIKEVGVIAKPSLFDNWNCIMIYRNINMWMNLKSTAVNSLLLLGGSKIIMLLITKMYSLLLLCKMNLYVEEARPTVIETNRKNI